MEKIYMEESKKQRKSVMNASVALSFVVSIFAVFSLAMFGIVMNQGTGISYAAPNPDVTTSFTLEFGEQYDVVGHPDGKIYGFNAYYINGTHTIANQVFCIERNKDVDEESYSLIETARSTEADVTEDYGLIYLLNIGQNETLRKKLYDDDRLSGYVVQSAIWKYLAEKYPTVDAFKLHKSGDYDDLSAMSSVAHRSFKIDGQTPTGPFTTTSGKIDTLVAEAKQAGAPKVFVTKADDEISKTEDGKYYQSSLITVTTTPTTISGYTITLSGIDGAIAVDEDGNEITGVVAPGKKFYVRIPAEKATEEVQKVQIDVSADFDATKVVYYKMGDDSRQRLATLKSGPVSGGTEVEFVTTGDTGMNTAQTIYFIGLIVLLCGVGIVYANVKPVEAKQ